MSDPTSPRHRRPRRTRVARREGRTGGTRIRQGVALLALVAAGVGCLVLGAQLSAERAEPPASGIGHGAVDVDVVPPPGPTPEAVAGSEPVRLDVPSVGIHARVVRLGLTADGGLAVPDRPMRAGWYVGSPTPGQAGPSVIVGHVDAKDIGPAVFYRLGELAVGAPIEATLADGRVARFIVAASRTYAKSGFPTDDVYGNTGRSTLRLITCGNWNAERETYDDNVVVFAVLESLSR